MKYYRDKISGYYYKIDNTGNKTRMSRHEINQVGGAKINLVPFSSDSTKWLKTARSSDTDIPVTYDTDSTYTDNVTADEALSRFDQDLPYPVGDMDWFNTAGIKDEHIAQKCRDNRKSDTVVDIVKTWGSAVLDPDIPLAVGAEQRTREDEYVTPAGKIVELPTEERHNYSKTSLKPAIKNAVQNCKLRFGGKEQYLVRDEMIKCNDLVCKKSFGPNGIRDEAGYTDALGIDDGKYKKRLERCHAITQWKCREPLNDGEILSKKNNYYIRNTGKGDCLFISFTNALHIHKQLSEGNTTVWSLTNANMGMSPGITKTINDNLERDSLELRHRVVGWLREHKDLFVPSKGGILKYVITKTAQNGFHHDNNYYGFEDAIAKFNLKAEEERNNIKIDDVDDAAFKIIAHMNDVMSLETSDPKLAEAVNLFADIALESYCDKMMEDTTYGTENEIFVLSQMYTTSIRIYNTTDDKKNQLQYVLDKSRDMEAKADAQKIIEDINSDPQNFAYFAQEYLYIDEDTGEEDTDSIKIYNQSQTHYEFILPKIYNGKDITLMDPLTAALKNVVENYFAGETESDNPHELLDTIKRLVTTLDDATKNKVIQELNQISRVADDDNLVSDLVNTLKPRVRAIKIVTKDIPSYKTLGSKIKPLDNSELKDLADQAEYFQEMYSILGIDNYIRDTNDYNENPLEIFSRLLQCYDNYKTEELRKLKGYMFELSKLYYDQQSIEYNQKPQPTMSFYDYIKKYLYVDGGHKEYTLEKVVPSIVKEEKMSRTVEVERDLNLYRQLENITGMDSEEIKITYNPDNNLTERQVIQGIVDDGAFDADFDEEVTSEEITTNFTGDVLKELIRQMKVEFVLNLVYDQVASEYKNSNKNVFHEGKLTFQVDAEYYMAGKLRETIISMTDGNKTELRAQLTRDVMLDMLSSFTGSIPKGETLYDHISKSYKAATFETNLSDLVGGDLTPDLISELLAENDGDKRKVIETLDLMGSLSSIFEKNFADVIETKFTGPALEELEKQIRIELTSRLLKVSDETGSIQDVAEKYMLNKLREKVAPRKVTNIQLKNAFVKCVELKDDRDVYECSAEHLTTHIPTPAEIKIKSSFVKPPIPSVPTHAVLGDSLSRIAHDYPDIEKNPKWVEIINSILNGKLSQSKCAAKAVKGDKLTFIAKDLIDLALVLGTRSTRKEEACAAIFALVHSYK